MKISRLFFLPLLSMVVAGTLQARPLDKKGSIPVAKEQKRDYHKMAKVPLNDAVQAALTKVPGKAVEADLDDEEGYLVYEVKVVSPNDEVTSVVVDAGDKSILRQHKEH